MRIGRTTMRRSLLAALAAASALVFGAYDGAWGDAGKISVPAKVEIGYIADRYAPVAFDHAMHTFFAQGCGDCHHQHDTDRNASCRDCHDIKPEAFRESVEHGFLPCASCHGEYNADMPEMPGLKVAFHKACFKCHVGMGNLGKSPKACAEKCHAGNER